MFNKEKFLESELVVEILQSKKNNRFIGELYLDKEPPIEWLSIGKSDNTGDQYFYMPIELLECLMDMFFDNWGEEKIVTTITSNATNASVTTTLTVFGTLNSERKKQINKVGAGSVYVEDNHYFDRTGKMHFKSNYWKQKNKLIKALQLTTTAVPLSLTIAKKNAISNICNLFGRNLNRNNPLIEQELIVSDNENEEIDNRLPAGVLVKQQYINALATGDDEKANKIKQVYKV